jgi:hypothetical protein
MDASPLVTHGIFWIAVVMAVVFVGAVGAAHHGARQGRAVVIAAAGAVAWMAVTWAVADVGLLSRSELRPPPMALLVASVLALGLAVGLSPVGRRLQRLPLAWLLLLQAFRLPLELVMHQAAAEGVMPPEMSYGAGYNYDIVTGAGALGLGLYALKAQPPRWLVAAWNAYGALCLLVILAVALASSPMIRAFGDDPAHVNEWVLHEPFVWLPAVLVTIAIAGHVVVARHLRSTRAALPARSEAAPTRS